MKINPLIVSVGPPSDSAIYPINPTEHSNGLKTVVAIATSILIPVAAPYITKALATSQILGATVASFASSTAGGYITSAIAGAAMGAVSAAVTGQNVSAGAITGALGGGLGQFGANRLAASEVSGAGAGAATGGPAPVTSATMPQSLSVNATPSLNQPIYSQTAADAIVRNTASEGTGGNFLTNLAGKFGLTAENAADVAIQAGSQLLGAYLAPDPGSPRDDPNYQRAVEEYKQELEVLRETNKELFDQRMQVAQNFLINARGYDPSYFADLNAKRTMLQQARVTAQQEEELRFSGRSGLTTGDKVRATLDAGLNVGQSYLTGQQQGMNMQNNLMTAGLNAMPTTGYNAEYVTAMGGLADSEAAFLQEERERADDERKNITKLAGRLGAGRNLIDSDDLDRMYKIFDDRYKRA